MKSFKNRYAAAMSPIATSFVVFFLGCPSQRTSLFNGLIGSVSLVLLTHLALSASSQSSNHGHATHPWVQSLPQKDYWRYGSASRGFKARAPNFWLCSRRRSRVGSYCSPHCPRYKSPLMAINSYYCHGYFVLITEIEWVWLFMISHSYFVH